MYDRFPTKRCEQWTPWHFMIVCSSVLIIHRRMLMGYIPSIFMFPNQGINLRDANGVYYFPSHLSLHQLNIFEIILDFVRDCLMKKNDVQKCSSQIVQN